MKVGPITVTPVDDGVGRLAPAQLFAYSGKAQPGRGAQAEDWAGHTDLLGPDGQLEMPIGCFVIRTGDRTVLVDAGYGPQGRPATVSGPRLPDNLAAAGVRPDEITDVVLTHLHTDHIGWSSEAGTATFPRATYRCAAADWTAFATGGDTPFQRFATATLGPIEDRFELWDSGFTLAPGVDVVPAAGHTPGSALLMLSAPGERALLLGDVVHHPVQLLDPDWERIADSDESAARATAQKVAADLVRDGIPATGAHFPGQRFGRLVTGPRWEPLP